MDALETLFEHQSMRNYTSEEVDPVRIANIEKAVRQCSSTCFFQLVTTIRITDRKLLAKIGLVSGGQMHIAKCPQLWMFCMDFTRLSRACDYKLPIPFDLFFAGVNDASIACEAALVAAEAQGLSCVIIGGFKRGLREICKLLDLPKGVAPVVALCLGYGDDKYREQQKPRLPKHWTFMENGYSDPYNEAELESYNQQMADYYQNRKYNARTETWSEAASEQLNHQPRLSEILAVFKEQGFAFDEAPLPESGKKTSAAS